MIPNVPTAERRLSMPSKCELCGREIEGIPSDIFVEFINNKGLIKQIYRRCCTGQRGCFEIHKEHITNDLRKEEEICGS